MPIEYEYSDEKPPEYILLDDGKYIVAVKAYKIGMSQARNTKIDLECEVEGHDGAIVYETLVFTDKSKWRVDSFIRSIFAARGKNPPGKGEKLNFDDDLLLTARGVVELGQEPWTGRDGKERKKNKIVNWLPEKTEIDGEETPF